MKHQYTKDDISDLKEAVKNLMEVRNRIETDDEALMAMDDLISPIEELIDNAEAQ